MNLDGVRTGRTVLVTGSGLSPARVRRLAELGIRTGQPVQVLGRTAGGGRLLAVGDARVAVDRSTARGIEVTETAADTVTETGPPARTDAPRLSARAHAA
ncbi:hypothetical protein GCM10027047_32470 [Rhodococcus aerolatus]